MIIVTSKLSLLPPCFSVVNSSSSRSKDMNTEPKKKVKLRQDWREKSKPIPPGGTYPAKDHCSQCGLCDTYYIAHVKDACAFLGDGMSRIEVKKDNHEVAEELLCPKVAGEVVRAKRRAP